MPKKSSLPTKKSSAKTTRRRKNGASKRSRNFKSLLWKISAVGLVLFLAWCVYLDAIVRNKFEGKRWQLPAQVYSRAMEIYTGQVLSKQAVVDELARLDYKRRSKATEAGTYAVGSRTVEIHTRTFGFPDGEQASSRIRVEFTGEEVENIVKYRGAPLNWLRLEPERIGGIYPAQKEDRVLVSLEETPEELKKALLLVEDRQFYEHIGISFTGIARAMWANLQAGKVVQGGSTVTQQLVKNFYLTSERSLGRKVTEALMSLFLDFHYEKNEILEAYGNEVFLGQSGSRAIHGWGMASLFYFGQPLGSLTVEKSALLVALVKGASYYNPRKFPARAKARRNLVLDILTEAEVISVKKGENAKSLPLGLVKKPRYKDSRYPAFMDLLREQLGTDYPEEALQTEGLRIFTSLDPAVQNRAEQALSTTIKSVESWNEKNKGLQGAVVVSALQSGEVLAVVGDRDGSRQGFNRALNARRQVGSLLKPVIAMTALAQPDKYSLATMVKDESFTIRFENGEEWTPVNFDGETSGDVMLFDALAASLNLASARLGIELGVPQVAESLRLLGVKQDLNPYPSLLLGATDLSPLQVAQLYQNIAATGFDTPLRAIRAVTRADGAVLSRYPFKTTQVVDPKVAYLTQSALVEVMRNGTGKRFYQRFPEDYYVAGKTGTTDEFRDSWFVGFNGDYIGTVWMGQDNNTPTSLTGSTGALQVWMELFGKLPQTSFLPTAPKDVEWLWVDGRTGKRSGEHCSGAVALPFIKGSEPGEYAQCVDTGSPLRRWWRSWFGG